MGSPILPLFGPWPGHCVCFVYCGQVLCGVAGGRPLDQTSSINDPVRGGVIRGPQSAPRGVQSISSCLRNPFPWLFLWVFLSQCWPRCRSALWMVKLPPSSTGTVEVPPWRNENYFFSAACAPGFRRPTANHAASRHFPCCFTQTVINWLLTSAILPLLLALRWMWLSTTAESPLYERT